MTDRAFCFCLALAILMVSDVAISTDDSEGVVLAKVMKAAKEIRPDDKKREGAPPRLGAGRLLACFRMLLAPDVCRLLAFLGAGEARREGPPPG